MTRRVVTRPVVARLSRSTDVRRVMREGQRRSGRLMALHSLVRSPEGTDAGPDAGPEGTRLTVVASRRVGNAVQRNRAKRLLRAAAREQAWRSDLDVVLVARDGCATSGLAAVSAELHELGTRLDAIEAMQ